MRMIVAAVIVCTVAVSGVRVGADSTSPCTFNLSADRPAPEIVGAPDVIARARVMTQPDSPLAIVRVDLSGVNLVAGPGSFEESGRYAVDVKNVSGQVLTDAQVSVHVVFGHGGSGVGSGFKVGRPVRPAEQARIEWKSGPGRGTHGTTEEVSVVAMVGWVTSAACKYMPSQAWPITRPSR